MDELFLQSIELLEVADRGCQVGQKPSMSD